MNLKLIALIGLWLKKHKRVGFILGSSLFSSILFFIITNFGVWAPSSNWYPHTLNGLIECYTLAVPFFRNTILGDLGYTVILFGGFELLKYFVNRFIKLPSPIKFILK